jgi:hypothetical protein
VNHSADHTLILLESGASLIAIIVGGLTLLTAGRRVWRFFKRAGHFLDDYFGTPAREGVPERPGVRRRLASQDNALAALNNDVAAIRHELPKNGVPLAVKVDALWSQHMLEMTREAVRDTIQGDPQA